MESKVIKVEHRKSSESFPEWMKYEITLLNEDGSKELIPAYGRDLQHALSRIVKTKRVESIKHKTNKIPMEVWVGLVFAYVTLITLPTVNQQNPLWLVSGLFGLGLVFFGLKMFFKK
tara:strand:+ start:308 stop:658 length:351 start_codon:yes stop_codon:yes gene_type:complete